MKFLKNVSFFHNGLPSHSSSKPDSDFSHHISHGSYRNYEIASLPFSTFVQKKKGKIQFRIITLRTTTEDFSNSMIFQSQFSPQPHRVATISERAGWRGLRPFRFDTAGHLNRRAEPRRGNHRQHRERAENSSLRTCVLRLPSSMLEPSRGITRLTSVIREILFFLPLPLSTGLQGFARD